MPTANIFIVIRHRLLIAHPPRRDILHDALAVREVEFVGPGGSECLLAMTITVEYGPQSGRTIRTRLRG